MSQHEQPPFGLPPPPPPSTSPPKRRRTGVVVGALVAALGLVAGIAAVAVLGGGEDTAQAQPLGLTFTQGQSETYQIHSTMRATIEAPSLGSQALDMDASQTVTWDVVSVADDGTATIRVSVTDVSGTVNGTEIPPSAAHSEPFEMQIASDGRIVSVGGMPLAGLEQAAGASFPGMSQFTPLLPDGPVSPGDSWEKDFSQDVPFGEGSIEFTATSTLEGYEEVDGVEAAKVTTEFTVPLDFTLDVGDLLATMGGSLGATGPPGAELDQLAGASIAYEGEGAFSMTSWIDSEAKAMLRSSSEGSFQIAMSFSGVPGFDGKMTFDGRFTQDVERV